MSERVVVLPLSPPRRLLAPTRWRSFKMRDDRTRWDDCWERVDALVADGWALERVEVDWGTSVPFLGKDRARLLARVFPAGVPVQDVAPTPSRGTTTVYLRRGDGDAGV